MLIDHQSIATQMLVFLIAFVTVLLSGPKVLQGLRILKFGQNINTDAPGSHAKKQGTPTMGGVLLVLGVFIALAIALFARRSPGLPTPQLAAVLFVFLGHALLGFLDDYLSVKRGRSLGLKARHKLAGQFVIAGLFLLWLSQGQVPNQTTVIVLWRGAQIDLGYLYYLFAFCLIVGLSNATNFSDGLDGLAGGLSIFAVLGLTWTCSAFAPGHEDMPWFGYALAGSCLGFLWYNAHPAKVFMGDTGSLAIGSSLAAMAIIGKHEVLLLIFSIVFLAELISVMIQVSVFKATGGKPNGRRVFRMTPLHHHFELGGMPETVIVARFWIVGVLALALGLLLTPELSLWIPGQ